MTDVGSYGGFNILFMSITVGKLFERIFSDSRFPWEKQWACHRRQVSSRLTMLHLSLLLALNLREGANILRQIRKKKFNFDWVEGVQCLEQSPKTSPHFLAENTWTLLNSFWLWKYGKIDPQNCYKEDFEVIFSVPFWVVLAFF